MGAVSEPDAEIRYPRRTERRRKTRAKLLEVAAGLFSTEGYGPTTMQAIADGADVHVTTLFTHFKAKGELARSLAAGELDDFRDRAFRSRDSQTVFEFMLSETMALAKMLEASRKPAHTLWYALATDDELAFAWSEYDRERKSVIADYVAAEFGLDREKDLRADLVAGLLLESASLPLQRWVEDPRRGGLAAEVRKALRMAEVAARAMLGKAA